MMNYQSVLAAIDKKFPGQSVFRETYRTAYLAETAMLLEKEFQSYREPPEDFAFSKHEFDTTYSFAFHRGWTTGFSFGLYLSKDREGQPVVLAGVSRSSKLRMAALYISLILAAIVAIAAIAGFHALGFALPPVLQEVAYVVIGIISLIACYYLTQPIVTMVETISGGRLPNETMDEITAKFRAVCEQKCTVHVS